MLKNLDDLIVFLHEWYGEEPGALALPHVPSIDPDGHKIPPPLTKLWLSVGKLLGGPDRWFEHFAETPLRCQYKLGAPHEICEQEREEFSSFAYENQTCFSYAYKNSSTAKNPPVFSDQEHEHERQPRFSQVGSSLSTFLITFCLHETAVFGGEAYSGRVAEVHDLNEMFGQPFWTSKMAHKLQGDEHETPLYTVRSNQDQTTIALYLFECPGDKDNTLAATRDYARARWQRLKTEKLNP